VPGEPTLVSSSLLENLTETLTSLATATPLTRRQGVTRLLSQVDVLADSREGLAALRERIVELHDIGVFQDGPWEDPDRLVPALVGGTLRAGGNTTLMEILSELRMLAIAEGDLEIPGYGAERAQEFLKEVLVNTLDLLFPGETEADRSLDSSLRARIDHLMRFLVDRIPLDRIKEALATEIELICLQRPVVTTRALRIIGLVRREVTLNAEDDADRRLAGYVEAVFSPSPDADARSPSEYRAFLAKADPAALEAESHRLSRSMTDTGLAVAYHALLVRRVSREPHLLAEALGLGHGGRAELERHHEFVAELIEDAVHPSTARSTYGLARLLDRGLLSRQPVREGLARIRGMSLHSDMAKLVDRSGTGGELPAPQVLLADCLCVLGQPLGVGQGKNPTCQSARGISLWSRHAPGKLLDMVRAAARTNDLGMRFEGEMVRSSEVAEGLLKDRELDYELDAVSLVLVPHLDRIYNEMMRRASHRGEDPHKWVNPAMYGHWIPTGFVSAYDAVSGRITQYESFLRTFYATHHPDFNEGHDLAYPNPVGIFLTSASGALIGFHAVSILRVRRWEGQVRVYIVNPNTEGRQRWYEDMSPTVAGHGEEHGESSLPFDQFASRLYAFHFHPSDVGDLEAVVEGTIARVEKAARASWGRSYQWVEVPRS